MRKTETRPSVPAIGQDKRGEAGHLGYLLRQAGAAHRRRVERALADLEVTPPQFTVLTMLAAYPGISNADLARIAFLAPPTVSLIAANLERAGALARRAHATHGRIRHLDVTPSGKRLLARCRRRVHAIDAELAAMLRPVEERAVRRWLVALARPDRADRAA
jgi:DNA-binding MarR family transcriptional regulator